MDLIEARGAAAQLCVIHDGRVVIDEAYGCEPDALFWLFSASKPYLAVLIYQLAEAGALDLDDPVVRHWPGFGKPEITIRHVLRHRSGLYGTLTGALTMTDWDRSVRAIARARPRWPAGEVSAYSPIAFGFILGEVVQRVTGRAVRDVMAERVPGAYLGIPDDQWHLQVPITVRHPLGLLVEGVVNRRATRQAVIPAAGISTTARGLAGFYDALLRGELLRPESLAAAVTPSNDGGMDPVARAPIRWAQGFQLGGGGGGPLGASSTARTFGHNGSNCCIGWADPERRLAYAYVTNRIEGRRLDVRHHAAVADGVRILVQREGDRLA
ncbi:serine hydrolase domain-containing protein [Cryptosporangium phraense]|uniref:serine hydrolase domain-containing protein n=1 Tax=Cryptosporangium phraense TaxID=2593070 RepID=UPI0014780682|nr:serine hydrolase domain-containing protein [Cryptosporangium phraense]